MRIRAAGFVWAPPPTLFEFLDDFDNYWQLIAGYGERGALRGSRAACVRLRGPAGLRRTVDTRVLDRKPPQSLAGTAALGSDTRATVRWSIQNMDGGSWVELSAHVHHVGMIDRALLLLGGRRWLQRGFDAALVRLADRFAVTDRTALSSGHEPRA